MSDGSRPSFARYREIMAAHGFRPSKRFGQNFLLDPSLHRAIADAAELRPDGVVLEVGPGLGFLTRELATRAARVVAVEIDDRLAVILRDEIAAMPEGDRVRLVHADAMAGAGLSPKLVEAVREAAPDRPVTVVANLPYAVSGRFLGALLGDEAFELDRVVVVVQRELAERLAAGSGSRDYGSLSVLAGARGTVELLRGIGRDVFRPRPNVDSALLRITCERSIPAGFAPWLREMFAGRRKMLRQALRRAGEDRAEVLERWGSRRAEECSVADFLELYGEVTDSGS